MDRLSQLTERTYMDIETLLSEDSTSEYSDESDFDEELYEQGSGIVGRTNDALLLGKKTLEMATAAVPHSVRIPRKDSPKGDAEEDPLYNPKADDEDELWVRKKFGAEDGFEEAHLSCPNCFTLLSVESQRHEQHIHQYRSVKVQNCTVNRFEVLKPERLPDTLDAGGPEAVLHGVTCEICGTTVGVLDAMGIFHFFDVLSN